ncbi:uncharacterized protein LOC130696740 [Daphnia carinata]|uniref:uncharacterized protein LOC130696740 n=1 Tax=Daphnia carinata TaxID=120202 RepID=UPI0025796338|nr:uncharacterized protein LOC130696740 [Daphnia carinata]
MSSTKVMVVLALVIAVVVAADVEKKTTNASTIQHVGSLLTAKARLTSVNVTANVTESKKNSTEKIVMKRSIGFDKSEGMSALTSTWWRIPTAIWQFINQVFLDPLVSALRRLLSIFGLDAEQVMDIPMSSMMQSVTPMNLVNQFMPQVNAP